MLSNNCPGKCRSDSSQVDSIAIIANSGKRPDAVTKELINKGFCFTKNMYYYRSKPHALSFSRSGNLPYSENLIVAPSSENDLNVQKQDWSSFYDRTFYGDKIYNDVDFFKRMTESYNSKMLIPMKTVKGQSQMIAQINNAANGLYSTAVSRIRQPIVALFHWLIEKQVFKERLRCFLPKA